MPAIGETISSSDKEVVIQSYQLDNLPGIGSIVEIDELLGIVTSSATGPIDQSRNTVALGENGDDINQTHPELSSLIRSTFTVRPIIMTNGDIVNKPPRLHAKANSASPKSLELLTKSFDHLNLIADLDPQTIISHIKELGGKNDDILIRAGQSVTRELSQDPEKLRQILFGLEKLA